MPYQGILSWVDDDVKEQILKLHGEGVSFTEIANKFDLSRTTVRRFVYKVKGIQERKTTGDIITLDGNCNPIRCPGCGGLVYQPCVRCRIERGKQRKRALKYAFLSKLEVN